ncbi:hypothetical protein EVG20_g1909 [Dentipellis fragilis]|uniref:Uncharacterized protein n=1 Tax=Dentipellis fragilis TaxID=205917 RepID=A0A4Y9ZBB4_9AGAM|nr:hypothetical protein EVG20_g1909 [Dentipellis fragilis]
MYRFIRHCQRHELIALEGSALFATAVLEEDFAPVKLSSPSMDECPEIGRRIRAGTRWTSGRDDKDLAHSDKDGPLRIAMEKCTDRVATLFHAYFQPTTGLGIVLDAPITSVGTDKKAGAREDSRKQASY